MLLLSEISALRFCNLCFFAAKAGMRGPAKVYGSAPGKQTGQYQRKLNRLLGHIDHEKTLKRLTVMGQWKYDLSRQPHNVYVNPLHEALAAEIENDPTLLTTKLEDRLRAGDFDHERYESHPVTQSDGPPVLPLSIFVDGVPYSKTDSVVGIWGYNEVSHMRHLLVVMRKRCMCKCGCRGWCSLWEIWRFIMWTLNACADGLWPARRSDSADWERPQDTRRAGKAGSALPFRGALVKIKGDLPEFASTFGFPGTGSVSRPCLKCTWCPALGFWEPLAQLNAFSFPSLLLEAADYDAACARCEKKILVGRAERDAILPLLAFDKRKTSASGNGLAMLQDFGPLGLRKKDRLEPSEELPSSSS